MVFIARIADQRALIFDGPVASAEAPTHITSSSNIEDAQDLWEFRYLQDKEVEWPALRQNALDALRYIDRHLAGPWSGEQRKILDFGAGWGFFLAAAQEQGWRPYGLEPLPATAVYARAKFGLDITNDTLREDTYPENFFDAITSFQVFEHLPCPQGDIQNLYKSLRRGGIILIEVPNFETWTMKILRSRHRHFVQDHINFFSRKTLSQFLSTNGFEIIDHYRPARRMSVRHLVKRWVSAYLPEATANNIQGFLRETWLWEKTFGVNLGDIITVIARKP